MTIQAMPSAHARYICPDTVYHVVSRTVGGSFFMVPTPQIDQIIVGVVAKARQRFKTVSLFEAAFLSNHFHILMQAPPGDFSKFVGFIKKEISRRVGRLHNWQGPLWEGRFKATALPTPASQINAARYVLEQGVKEDLVENPWDWPGLHSAKWHKFGRPLEGVWLNGTAYAKARDAASRSSHPFPKRQTFETTQLLTFDPLPAYAEAFGTKHQPAVIQMLEDISFKHDERRKGEGKQVLGIQRAKSEPATTRSPRPQRPWLEHSRTLVAWASPKDPKTRVYLHDYWSFQEAFTQAAQRMRQQDPPAGFPLHAHIPGRACDSI